MRLKSKEQRDHFHLVTIDAGPGECRPRPISVAKLNRLQPLRPSALNHPEPLSA